MIGPRKWLFQKVLPGQKKFFLAKKSIFGQKIDFLAKKKFFGAGIFFSEKSIFLQKNQKNSIFDPKIFFWRGKIFWFLVKKSKKICCA